MSNLYYRKTASGQQVEYTPYYDDKGKFSLYFNSTNGTQRVGFDNEDDMQDFAQKVAPEAKQSWRNNGFDLVLLEPNTKVINLPEIEVFGDTSKQNNTQKQPKQTQKVYQSDPIIQSIFNGFYNGHKFTPTEQNIRHYLDMYKNDKHVNEEYSQQKWGNVFGSHAALGTAIATAPFVPWGKALPWVAKNVVAPMVLGEGYKWLENKLTGQNLSTNISNYLQTEKGWNPFAAQFAGDLTNPGYWVNFAGQGKWTKPFFDKIGWNAFGKTLEQQAADRLAATPAVQSAIQQLMPKSKFQTSVVEPANKWIDQNLYKLQKVSNPFLARNKFNVSEKTLPIAKFKDEPTDIVRDENVYYLPLFKNSDGIYQNLKNLKIPEINLNAYDWFPNINISNTLATAAATDLALNGDHRNPYIQGIEYGLIGKAGLDNFLYHRLANRANIVNDYVNNFSKSFQNARSAFIAHQGRLQRHKNRFYKEIQNQNGESKIEDIRKLSFDNLKRFLTKRYENESSFSEDVIYYNGRPLAKKGENGEAVMIDNASFRDLLSTNTNVYDYQTGKNYTGKIEVTDGGQIIFPENYIETLNRNIQYVKDKYFNGIDVQLFGSSGPVTQARFPHGTDDIDFYVTQSGADALAKKGIIPTSNTAVTNFQIPGVPENVGKIDVNIIQQEPNGFATGERAEELFKQYFPDEYYEALLQSKVSGEPLKINKTPEELLKKIDPSVKSIMDSFDVDYMAPKKGKHAVRGMQHILYSDPAKTSQAIYQYAQSMLGSNIKLFPIDMSGLSDYNVNVQALNKLAPHLTSGEVDILAKNPERMKNFLDAWYILDNTAMRSIETTWPGIKGNTVQGAKNSATIWIPEENHGTANGVGLNTTIGGDSGVKSRSGLKAFISPKQEYKSNNLLDLIDEVLYNFGRHPDAPNMLEEASINVGDPKKKLQKIYNDTGFTFLQNNRSYGLGKYASATRDFDVQSGDAVGFAPINTYMRSLSDRLQQTKSSFTPNMFSDNNNKNNTSWFTSPLYKDLSHQFPLYKVPEIPDFDTAVNPTGYFLPSVITAPSVFALDYYFDNNNDLIKNDL